ncbi:MAG: hypothetical protein KC589_11355, partial [Nanoarchaeota archaeon]|nr:hypothetical protein [Nanoarchaeota archaeon]
MFSFFNVYSGSLILNQTILNGDNITVGEIAQFELFVNNQELYDIMDDTFVFTQIYNSTYLNFSNSSFVPLVTNPGNITWKFNISSMDNETFYINFTALQSGFNLSNSFILQNLSVLVENDTTYFNIFDDVSPILNVSIIMNLLDYDNISINDSL